MQHERAPSSPYPSPGYEPRGAGEALDLRTARPPDSPEEASEPDAGPWPGRNRPVVLAGSVLLGVLLGAAAPSPWGATVGLFVYLALAAASDARHGIIPNALTLAALGFATAVWLSPPTLAWEPVLAAVVAVVAVAALRAVGAVWLGAPGFGLGDVKLAAPLGLLLGWGALWALYLGVVLAAAVAVAGLATGRLGRRSRLPFAPFVLGGVLLGFVFPFGRALAWVAAWTT